MICDEKITDLHLHAGWTDFDRDDQDKRTKEDIVLRVESFLIKYKKAGVSLARDACGFSDELRTRIRGDVCDVRDNWIKIFVTAGVGRGSKEVLEPVMSKESFMRQVRKIHDEGKLVMVHCYGGVSLDWCIEAGADSIEHGVYMTREQAFSLAKNNIAYIPTAAIYRLLAHESDMFNMPKAIKSMISENAKAAADAHVRAVQYALDEGVLIGHGTDFYADDVFIEHIHDEIETLMDLGLSRGQAIKSATADANKILDGSFRQRQA